MSIESESQKSPRLLLSTFMPSALAVIVLVFLNLIQPNLINGPYGTIFSVVFWIALTLSLVSLIGLAWFFIRLMASNGFSFIERLSLGILVPAAVIVVGMAILAVLDPGGVMAGSAVNQLFWGMFALMSISLVLFCLSQFTKGNRRRKKKGKLYYY